MELTKQQSNAQEHQTFIAKLSEIDAMLDKYKTIPSHDQKEYQRVRCFIARYKRKCKENKLDSVRRTFFEKFYKKHELHILKRKAEREAKLKRVSDYVAKHEMLPTSSMVKGQDERRLISDFVALSTYAKNKDEEKRVKSLVDNLRAIGKRSKWFERAQDFLDFVKQHKRMPASCKTKSHFERALYAWFYDNRKKFLDEVEHFSLKKSDVFNEIMYYAEIYLKKP